MIDKMFYRRSKHDVVDCVQSHDAYIARHSKEKRKNISI